MLKLCGFSASNYYNKVKLALLEKEIPFEEVEVWTNEVDRAVSPMGKVPYLLTERGPLSESAVMLDYIEQLTALSATAGCSRRALSTSNGLMR